MVCRYNRRFNSIPLRQSEKIRILFLDADGVLNNRQMFMEAWKNQGLLSTLSDEMVDHLKRIVDATSAEIVVTSSWRLFHGSMDVLTQKLAEKNLTVKDKTIYLGKEGLPRSHEIQEWLNRHDVERSAILDDDPNAEIPGSFFLCDFGVGLTPEITEAIIQHFLQT